MSAKVLSWQMENTKHLDSHELTILVLAPIGRDGSLIVEALTRGGFRATFVADVDELCTRMAKGAGAAIISEEALMDYAVARISKTVTQQPTWSDFPLLILTIAGEAGLSPHLHHRFCQSLGNYALLERPIRLETLLRAVTTAVRARQRQYEIRDHLEERKRSEAALAKSEARHRLLVTASSAIIWSANSDGRFTEPQESWERFTGQDWSQHQERGWVEVVHPEDRQPLLDAWKNARERSSVLIGEGRLWNKQLDCFRRFELRGVPLTDGWGRIEEWVGIVTDVEDRKKAEEALRKSEKLASAGRLAATIAHEINNPLAAVTNLLYLAKNDATPDSNCKKFLEMSEHELNRVIHITKQTLAFYRDSAGKSSIAIKEMVEGLVTIYGKRISTKGAKLVIQIADDMRLTVNAGEIRQVISNLLSNALDAVGQGGKIVVRVRNVKARGVPGVRIVVSDNGCGIAKEHLRKVFEPFFTTKEKIGTGLGLWVCRDLVEKNGGEMSFRSSTTAAQCGTTFVIFFPDESKAKPA